MATKLTNETWRRERGRQAQEGRQTGKKGRKRNRTFNLMKGKDGAEEAHHRGNQPIRTVDTRRERAR